MDFSQMSAMYRRVLTDEVAPFWLSHGVDPSGAINNCMKEDGTVLCKDRYIWSQGRALWTFSALYNRIEPRTEYLRTADGLFRYLLQHGRDASGKWMYLLDEDGNVKETDTSIYVDGFVLAGMTEYYNATGNEEAKRIALETYENTRWRLNHLGSYRVAPYVIPNGMKTHGVNMIFAYFYYELGKALRRPDICEEGAALANEVLDKFYIPEKDAILEFVRAEGGFVDSPEGRACVPGHAIECMWFLISIFEDRGETEKISKCCRIIRRHIALGMNPSGGMRLALDIDGKEPCFWGKPTYQPWWVQVETLVATAEAYRHTHDEEFLALHEKVRAFAFSHYPNGYGDWINWLDENGKVGTSAALPVKDPFHLPRGLMMLTKTFARLAQEEQHLSER